jgi:hypothetical protein
VDLLPSVVTEPFLNSFVRRLDIDELSRAFRIVIPGLVREISRVDEELGFRLQEVLMTLSDTLH